MNFLENFLKKRKTDTNSELTKFIHNEEYISENTLKMMDSAIENIKNGIASKPINLDEMKTTLENIEKYSIKLHNDGKCNYQSFEATIDDKNDPINLTGYGSNKEEAISNLKEQITIYIEKLNNIDYSKITFVDWSGKPLPL